jgi:hypothetical protein
MKILLPFSIISIIFLATSCPKKDYSSKPDVLPAITQTGANTFGCLINGKVWLPTWGGGHWPMNGGFNPGGKFFMIANRTISNSNSRTTQQTLQWSVLTALDTGKYLVKIIYPDLGAHFSDYLASKEYTIQNQDSLKNWVHITKLDSFKGIVSGTFNFFLVNPGVDSISVTNGRFDYSLH